MNFALRRVLLAVTTGVLAIGVAACGGSATPDPTPTATLTDKDRVAGDVAYGAVDDFERQLHVSHAANRTGIVEQNGVITGSSYAGPLVGSNSKTQLNVTISYDKGAEDHWAEEVDKIKLTKDKTIRTLTKNAGGHQGVDVLLSTDDDYTGGTALAHRVVDGQTYLLSITVSGWGDSTKTWPYEPMQAIVAKRLSELK